MRISAIRFENLNSLKGHYELDFEHGPLANPGIFAITGPTGAGKTTIFDAVTLALYGRAPRHGSSTEEVLSKGENRCMAEVDFSISATGGRYRATWSRALTRNGSIKPPDHKLEELTSGLLLTERTSTTVAKVAEITGLDEKQFQRTVLLVQGEFAAFLKATATERSDLLAKITGTEIYTQLSTYCYDENNRKQAEVASLKEKLGLIAVFTEDELKQKQERQISLETEIQNVASKVKNLRTNVELARHAASVKQKLETAQQKLDTLATELTTTESQKNAAHQARVEAQAAWDRAQEPLKQARQLDTLLKTNADEVAKIKAELAVLEKQETERKDALTSHKTKLDTDSSRLEKGNQWLQDHSADAECKDHAQKLDLLRTALPGLKDKVNAAKEKLETARAVISRLATLASSSKTLDTDQCALVEEVKAVTATLQSHEKAKLDAEYIKELASTVRGLAEHRQQLKAGEDCPLCGSQHHPLLDGAALEQVESRYTTAVESIAKLDKEIATTRTQLTGAEKKLTTTTTKISEQTKQENSLKEDLAKLGQTGGGTEFLVALETQLTTALAGEKAAQTNISAFIVQHSLPEDYETALKQLKKTASNFVRNQAAVVDLKLSTTELKGHVEAAKASLDETLAQLKGKADHLSLSASALQAKQRERQQVMQGEGAAEVETRLKKSLDTQVAREKSAEAAWQKIALDQKGLLEVTKQHNAEWAELADQAASQQLLLGDLIVKQQELAASLNTLVGTETALQEERGGLREALAKDAEQQQTASCLKEALSKASQAALDWSELNVLIGSRSGALFGKFAQALTLDLLISRANMHLAYLSSRYTMERVQEADALEFRILDKVQGDNQRSVKSLSGGETFLISLAMALGVSDLASQAHAIETLFVDEGFGALDSQTLDTALDALDRLRGEGKMIGLISHMPQVKERVAVQIALERGNDGWSTLKIN